MVKVHSRYIYFIMIFFSMLHAENNIKSKELYLDIEKYPPRVFTAQKFDIKIKATILKSKKEYDNVVLSFSKEQNIQILTKQVNWEEVKENIFFADITFKANDTSFTLPKLTLALLKGDDIVDFITINSPKIKFEKIAVASELYSNVIAKDLQILTAKTKQYNNNTLHTTLNIEGINSNLEDIYFKNYKEQGIKSFDEKYPYQNIYYYVMTPVDVKNLKFSYYNSLKKEFIVMNIPIILQEDLVSTQTDLNPYNSSLLFYKQSMSVFFLVLFLVLYFVRKKDIYLFLSAVFICVVTYLYLPNKKLVLYSGTDIYILPTSNSTVYKKLQKRHLVEVVEKKGSFYKVLFQNHNTGWIKENDIQ